jgi:hypothetical protein
MMDKPYAVSLGDKFPQAIPTAEGGVTEFFRNDANSFFAFLPDMTPTEVKVLRRGKLRAGLIVDLPLIMWVFSFGDKMQLQFTPNYDSRIVSEDEFTPMTFTGSERIAMMVTGVDSASGIIKALRMVTLPPVLCKQFASAVHAQRSMAGSMAFNQKPYDALPIEELIKRIPMYPCGEN